MEKHLQRCLTAAAEQQCDCSGGTRAPSSVLAVLSSWFIILSSPILAPRESALFEAVFTQVIESPHPYLDSQDISHIIKPSDQVIGSVEYMEVVFDLQCRTETNCDYVSFWKDGTRQGLQKYVHPPLIPQPLLRDKERLFRRYHGHSPGVWAGVGSTEVLRVQGSSMEARFHSDSSNNDWGYKFTVTFFAKPQHSISPFYKVIGPAMSCLPLIFAVNHDVPLLDKTLCKSFALYMKTLASLPDLDVDAIFRGEQHDSIINYLNVLLLMKSLGHCDEASVHSLFKKIYLFACVTNKELFLPPSDANQDIISEIGSVLSEHVTDSTLRAMIDKAFVDCSAMSVSSLPSSRVLFSIVAAAIDCRVGASSPDSASTKIVGSCSNQHPMTLCTSIPLAMMQASRGWMCSVCNKHIPLFQTGVWYCETCSYVPSNESLISVSSPYLRAVLPFVPHVSLVTFLFGRAKIFRLAKLCS
jgi:hypothetical protein